MSARINLLKIAQTFGSASQSYDNSARLQRYSGQKLLSWLPEKTDLTVLDLGSGTGYFTELLAEKYQSVIGLDLSNSMLQFAQNERTDGIHWLQADAHKLPFQDESIDLIYSNLMIQWCDPLDDTLQEIRRILKPGGSFIFTTLIDGTLHELKYAWAQVDNDQHVNDFKESVTLNQLFDANCSALEKQISHDVVLDYDNVMHLARELKGLGASHVPAKRKKGLSGKDKWQQMLNSYQDFKNVNGSFPATYRVYSGQMIKY